MGVSRRIALAIRIPVVDISIVIVAEIITQPVHFVGYGIKVLGEQWHDKVYNQNPNTSTFANYIEPDIRPRKLSSSTFELFVYDPFNKYNSYRWVNSGADKNNYLSTGTTFTTSGGSYRVYARYGQTNSWELSPEIQVPLLSCGSGREAALETNDADFGQLKFVIAANPIDEKSTIQFKLHSPSKVRIEIIDESGHPVKLLVDSMLNEGKFEYNLSLANQPTGIYFCRFQVDNVASTQKFIKLGR